MYEQESWTQEAFSAEVREHDDAWDAGDMGCGDLVLALRNRLSALTPGGVLKVTAFDPAAPEDLPAWCRLTGHRLLHAHHPEFYIMRKEK
jgi:tRNA 2-thiouridine synthesizing protein A